ncbi:MAG: DUF1326 domain-containing protein [bacterium]
MSPAAPRWEISGEYFENCSCDVVCPCEVSSQGPMQARPDQGYCNVYPVFHVNPGRYGGVDLAASPGHGLFRQCRRPSRCQQSARPGAHDHAAHWMVPTHTRQERDAATSPQPGTRTPCWRK